MVTVKAMTITVNSLLPRPKLDYDVDYDAAVKGASVIVKMQKSRAINFTEARTEEAEQQYDSVPC